PTRTDSILAPAIRSARLWRVTSTSGNSGMARQLQRGLDYYHSMKRFPLTVGTLLLVALAQTACAQLPAKSQPEPAGEPQTALDAELFYQLLLGEINAGGAEP